MTSTATTGSAAVQAPASDVPDELCAAAIELAREALSVDVAADAIGEYLGATADDERVVTHRFNCLDRGYAGWQWAVTVARADKGEHVTVDEVVLLPGPHALVAPLWHPWQDRVEPGDLGVGDLLPTAPDDPRLAPGLTGEGDLEGTQTDEPLQPPQWELGLGRVRVLSPWGRQEAAQRWYDGDAGPDTPIARAAAGACVTCGFLLPIGGSLGQAFGVCANGYSPSDGHVVSAEHGCGAHSEAPAEPTAVPVVELIIDDLSPEALDRESLTADADGADLDEEPIEVDPEYTKPEEYEPRETEAPEYYRPEELEPDAYEPGEQEPTYYQPGDLEPDSYEPVETGPEEDEQEKIEPQGPEAPE